MTGFLIGLLIGCPIGYAIHALMQTASAEDDRTLDEVKFADEEIRGE